jgi:hypothetical protein
MQTPKIIGHDEELGVYVLTPDGMKEKQDLVIGEERVMRASLVRRHLRWLLGDALTVLDAAMPQGQQLEATKSLMRHHFHPKADWIYQQCGCPEGELGEIGTPDDYI